MPFHFKAARSVDQPGDFLRQNQEKILSIWEAEVRKAVPSLRDMSEPMLIDTLPRFLEGLALFLSQPDPESHALRNATICHAHGSFRANFSSSSLSNLVQEYEVLRGVLMTVLGDQGLSQRNWRLIHRCLDKAIADSVTGLSIAHGDTRERLIFSLTHDMRSPLTSAIMSNEMILRYSKQPEDKTLASRAVDSLHRTNIVIQDLIEGVRLGSLRKTEIHPSLTELGGLLEEVVQSVDPVHGQDRFRIESSGAIEGYWDREQLSQGVRGLLNIATKFSTPNEQVSLMLSRSHGRVQIGTRLKCDPSKLQERLALIQGATESHGGSAFLMPISADETEVRMDILQDARLLESDLRKAA